MGLSTRRAVQPDARELLPHVCPSPEPYLPILSFANQSIALWQSGDNKSYYLTEPGVALAAGSATSAGTTLLWMPPFFGYVFKAVHYGRGGKVCI